MYRSLAVLVVTVGSLCTTPPAACKCVNRIIYIEGSIVGSDNDGLSVKVKVVVTPDPNWEPQPEISIKDGKFSGEVYFDATKSEGRARDNCSRVPEEVEVVLLMDGREVNRIRLNVSKAFRRDVRHDYKLRSPIVLHSQ